jgi:LmbE family N-acetylglucosaminyl deacetylase
MRYAHSLNQVAAWLALASLLPTYALGQQSVQQQPATSTQEPTAIALPLPEDRGAAALEQSLRRLGTWASLMMMVAHPDDEDGGMLTYESRGQGVRTSLLTLTRGEGGQNAMSADSYDALGLIRTNELLKAGEYYGVKQYFGTEADFGFSKTMEEAFARWGHERVLCDAVLAVRQERPLVLVSSFIGGITDGHGQHQVSGEISQEAYLQAGDPKVCPEQIAAGLQPWTPLKVYARTPFAPVNEKGMFDYATGKWAPARFYNYVTKEWTTTAPSGNADIPEGQLDPVLGRSYVQISREGWGMQKSQYGGANPTLSGESDSDYHLYGSRTKATAEDGGGLFKGIPTGIDGLESLLASEAPSNIRGGLHEIAMVVERARSMYQPTHPEGIASMLSEGLRFALSLRTQVTASSLSSADKYTLTFELNRKIAQFQTALAESLGLDLQAFTVRGASSGGGGPFGGGGVEETPRSVTPGQAIQVKIHTNSGYGKAKLTRVWLESSDGKSWQTQVAEKPDADAIVKATVPADAAPTEPYFTRPSIEQAYYDVASPALRDRPLAPYPLAAWAEFDYDGVPIRLSEVVQTMHRINGPGGVFEPLVITPPIGLRLEPEARILPLDGSPLPVRVTVHSEGPADGKLALTLPQGWKATPAEASFHRTQAGDSEPITFEVSPAPSSKNDNAFSIQAKAESGGHTYATGWQTIGYPGLLPYNLYRKAELKTRAVDAKIVPGLKLGYIMGTGDTVPEAIEELTGTAPHMLSDSDLASGDLSAWDAIVIGIRAYSTHPESAGAQTRLNAYVQNGGTLIVQYQGSNFPAPFPLSLGRIPERVVEENAPVKILAPENSLLTFPNQITSHDFDGWVEERGHSFLDSWDSAYTPLTETADIGQDPQRGGLVVAHPGKGTYVYVAFALHRQLPELVPGAYRLLANLLSAGRTSRAR